MIVDKLKLKAHYYAERLKTDIKLAVQSQYGGWKAGI